MEFEDFGARFSVAIEDFAGSWATLQDVGTLDNKCTRLIIRYVLVRTVSANYLQHLSTC